MDILLSIVSKLGVEPRAGENGMCALRRAIDELEVDKSKIRDLTYTERRVLNKTLEAWIQRLNEEIKELDDE
jgi:hypothetical protein